MIPKHAHFLPGLVARSALLLGLFWAPAASAQTPNPSNEAPHLPLALWGTQDAAKLRDEAELLYKRSREKIAEMQAKLAAMPDKVAAKQFTAIKLTEPSQVAVDLERLRRRGRVLAMWGEPAGMDFELKSAALLEQTGHIMGAMRLSYAGPLARGLTTLRKLTVQNQKHLKKFELAIERQEFAQVERTLYPLYDKLQLAGAWFYENEDREGTMRPYDAAVVNLEKAVLPFRRGEIVRLIVQQRQELAPDFAAAIAELNKAAEAIRTTGVYEIEGRVVTGPDMVTDFGARWRRIHLMTLHCLSRDLARLNDGNDDRAKLQQDHANFSAAFAGTLVKLVESDAARAGKGEAERLYPAYVQAIASFAGLANEDLTSRFSAPLATLAAKSPQLLRDTANYRSATSDLLRWRARSAEARAISARESHPAWQEQEAVSHQFRGPAPATIERAAKVLIGAKTSFADLIGSSEKNRATSRLLNRSAMFVRTDLSMLIGRAASELGRDLLVSTETPPLSLEAAMAIEAARRGDLAEAGGEVTRCELIGLAPLYSQLTENDWGLVRLGTLPGDPQDEPLSQVRFEVLLTPKWLRQKHFFVAAP